MSWEWKFIGENKDLWESLKGTRDKNVDTLLEHLENGGRTTEAGTGWVSNPGSGDEEDDKSKNPLKYII